jgi:hypothetical protein
MMESGPDGERPGTPARRIVSQPLQGFVLEKNRSYLAACPQA